MKRAGPSSSSAAVCGGCRSDEPFLLFNVKLRTIYRHLCPSCVLKFHPNSFCPICLRVYDDDSSSSFPPPPPPPPPASSSSSSSSSPSSSSLRVGCLKCQSLAHTACVAPDALPSYHCPPCADPSFLFFRLPSTTPVVLDKDSAKALLAAAHIAHSSVVKAASAVRSEADKRVKEAAVARKRAREAIERVQFIVSKERAKSLTRDSKALCFTPPLLSAGITQKIQKQPPIHVQSGLLEAEIIKKLTAAAPAVSRSVTPTPTIAKDVYKNHSLKVEESNGLHLVSPMTGLSDPQHQQNSH